MKLLISSAYNTRIPSLPAAAAAPLAAATSWALHCRPPSDVGRSGSGASGTSSRTRTCRHPGSDSVVAAVVVATAFAAAADSNSAAVAAAAFVAAAAASSVGARRRRRSPPAPWAFAAAKGQLNKNRSSRKTDSQRLFSR